jgi:hypothetical protein
MDPRIDVRGRIAELFAAAPRSTATGSTNEPDPAASAATGPTPGRLRAALGGALIAAGRALAGDQGTRAQTVARR